jgi:hypothetical protein
MSTFPDSTHIAPVSVWRQAVCLCASWIAVIVSLIAFPSILPFTLVAFVGLLLALGISWSRLGRSARAAQVPAAPPPPIATARTPARPRALR